MPFRFSSRSLERLRTCHADLVLLMTEAIADPDCPSDFSVLEGFRDEAAQDAAYDSWPWTWRHTLTAASRGIGPIIIRLRTT